MALKKVILLQRQKEKETDETRSVKNKRMQRQTISEGDERIIRKRRHRDEQQGERKDGERGCRKNVILSKITARLRPKYCTSPRVNQCSECLPEANRTRGIWNIRYKKLKAKGNSGRLRRHQTWSPSFTDIYCSATQEPILCFAPMSRRQIRANTNNGWLS